MRQGRASACGAVFLTGGVATDYRVQCGIASSIAVVLDASVRETGPRGLDRRPSSGCGPANHFSAQTFDGFLRRNACLHGAADLEVIPARPRSGWGPAEECGRGLGGGKAPASLSFCGMALRKGSSGRGHGVGPEAPSPPRDDAASERSLTSSLQSEVDGTSAAASSKPRGSSLPRGDAVRSSILASLAFASTSRSRPSSTRTRQAPPGVGSARRHRAPGRFPRCGFSRRRLVPLLVHARSLL